MYVCKEGCKYSLSIPSGEVETVNANSAREGVYNQMNVQKYSDHQRQEVDINKANHRL